MATYDITIRITADDIADAKTIGECITDPGAQVADVAYQMGARILDATVTEVQE
jgi:hypothetical protein